MSSSNANQSTSVLSELEWDDGFAIPVANEPNKKLENTPQDEDGTNDTKRKKTESSKTTI